MGIGSCTHLSQSLGIYPRSDIFSHYTLSVLTHKIVFVFEKLTWKIFLQKLGKHLLQVEASALIHFWLFWSKCWPDPHDTSVHFPFIDTDSINKHSLYDPHLPSTCNLTLSVQIFAMGSNICFCRIQPNGHFRVSYSPSIQTLYHSQSAVNGSLSSSLHPWKKISVLELNYQFCLRTKSGLDNKLQFQKMWIFYRNKFGAHPNLIIWHLI